MVMMAITDVDSTGKSYYGETKLYLVLTNGNSFMVALGASSLIVDLLKLTND